MTMNNRDHLTLISNDKLKERCDDSTKTDYIGWEEEFSRQFYEDWCEFSQDRKIRDDYIRTIIEIDNYGIVHPYIALDHALGEYGILNILDFYPEKIDEMLWTMVINEKEPVNVFVPKKAVNYMEKKLKNIIEDISSEEIEESLLFTLARRREIYITLNDVAAKFKLYIPDKDGAFLTSETLSLESKAAYDKFIDEKMRNTTLIGLKSGDYELMMYAHR